MPTEGRLRAGREPLELHAPSPRGRRAVVRRLPWRDGLADALTALASSASDHVAPILDVRERGDVVEVERAWVDGTPLSDRLAIEGPRPPMEVVRLGVDLCRALQALHRIDVPRLGGPLLHGTLDPGAIVRTADGTTVLTDAGHWATVNRLGAAIESGPHLAPPTPTGPVPRSPGDDVYAVGVLLHTALTGSRPEDGAVVSPLVARCPADLLEIVAESLHPDPELRPRTCGALRARLSGILCRALAAPPPVRRAPDVGAASDALPVAHITEQHGSLEVFPGEVTPWDSLHPVADLPTEQEGRRRLHLGIRWAGWAMAVAGLGLAMMPLIAEPPPAEPSAAPVSAAEKGPVERPHPVAAARPQASARPALPRASEPAGAAAAGGGPVGSRSAGDSETRPDRVAGPGDDRSADASERGAEAEARPAEPRAAGPAPTRSPRARRDADPAARRSPARRPRSRTATEPTAAQPDPEDPQTEAALQIRYRDAEDAPDVPPEPPRRRASGWPAPPLPDLLPVE